MPDHAVLPRRSARRPAGRSGGARALFRIGISDERSYEGARVGGRPRIGAGLEPVAIDLSKYSGFKWSLFYRPREKTWKVIFNTTIQGLGVRSRRRTGCSGRTVEGGQAPLGACPEIENPCIGGQAPGGTIRAVMDDVKEVIRQFILKTYCPASRPTTCATTRRSSRAASSTRWRRWGRGLRPGAVGVELDVYDTSVERFNQIRDIAASSSAGRRRAPARPGAPAGDGEPSGRLPRSQRRPVPPSHGRRRSRRPALSYADLDRQADALACFSRRAACPAATASVSCCQRACPAVVAIFGVLKAGAAYVPVDRSAPPDRGRRILTDCDIRALIVDAGCLDVVPQGEAQTSLPPSSWLARPRAPRGLTHATPGNARSIPPDPGDHATRPAGLKPRLHVDPSDSLHPVYVGFDRDAEGRDDHARERDELHRLVLGGVRPARRSLQQSRAVSFRLSVVDIYSRSSTAPRST